MTEQGVIVDEIFAAVAGAQPRGFEHGGFLRRRGESMRKAGIFSCAGASEYGEDVRGPVGNEAARCVPLTISRHGEALERSKAEFAMALEKGGRNCRTHDSDQRAHQLAASMYAKAPLRSPCAMPWCGSIVRRIYLPGLPAISVPCGFTREGLPVGIANHRPRV